MVWATKISSLSKPLSESCPDDYRRLPTLGNCQSAFFFKTDRGAACLGFAVFQCSHVLSTIQRKKSNELAVRSLTTFVEDLAAVFPITFSVSFT